MNHTENHEGNKNPDHSGLDRVEAKGRRDFLKKAGKFAIYVPPAVMLMSNPSKATLLNSASGKVCNRESDRQSRHNRFNQYNRHSSKDWKWWK